MISRLTGSLGRLGVARVSAGIVITYLLRDEFTTDEAAPITVPRTSEPGPGEMTAMSASVTGL